MGNLCFDLFLVSTSQCRPQQLPDKITWLSFSSYNSSGLSNTKRATNQNLVRREWILNHIFERIIFHRKPQWGDCSCFIQLSAITKYKTVLIHRICRFHFFLLNKSRVIHFFSCRWEIKCKMSTNYLKPRSSS